jgi:nucleotide-binding universal stress UspA family protein
VTGLLCLSVILTMDPLSRAAGVGLVALSLLWYVVWVRRKAVVAGEIGPLLERERPLEGVIDAAESAVRRDKHEVLIPLLDNANPAALMELATAMALADEHIVISLLDLDVVPEQTPLETAQKMIQQRQGTKEYALTQMAAQAAAQGVPVRSLRRAVRGLDSGVLAIVESRPAVGLILIGWEGALSASQIYGSPAKRILAEAECDVAVLRAREVGEINHILVPVGGGPHARLGLRLAAQIARGDGCKLTAMRVLRPGDELDMDVEMEGLRKMVTEILGDEAANVSTRLVVHDTVADAIVHEAEEGAYDLLAIGASEEWHIKSLLVGSLPDTIADRAPCSVLMVRRYESAGISATRRIVSTLRGWR